MTRRIAALLLALCGTLACTPEIITGTATPSPSPTASARPSPTSTSPLVFSVGAMQTRLVATTVAFFDAWNAGDVDRELALVTADVVGADCDYQAARRVEWVTVSELASWLRDRTADHDHLEIESILNENPDPITGGRVVAVNFTARSSDSLRGLGKISIDPDTSAKVVFAADGRKVIALALAGGGPNGCRA